MSILCTAAEPSTILPGAGTCFRLQLSSSQSQCFWHQFYDFGEWVNVVATNGEALDRFNAQMKECVVATYTLDTFYSAYGTYGTYPINLDVYSGVTTSAPSDAYTGEWKTTNWYKEVIALEN